MRLTTPAPIRRGEIWWVDFDPSIGGEIQKRRPAIVVSNDRANARLNRVQVVLITSNIDRMFPGEAFVQTAAGTRKAMANQIMTAAKERFSTRMDKLDDAQMTSLEAAIRVQLGL